MTLINQVSKRNLRRWQKLPSEIVKKSDYNAKITEIESKIPIITGLATALNAVQNKIRDVNNLVKKTDYDVKISDYHINKFTCETLKTQRCKKKN